jgi:chromosomal replication initiator protein
LHDELDTTWQPIRARIRDELTDYAFHIWVEPLEPAARTGSTLFVRAPRHIRGWVQDRYGSLLRDAAGRVAPEVTSVELVDEDWTPPSDVASPTAPLPTDAERLNPKYTFEQFVIGAGNHLAHTAALAVAEQPAQTFNPLFLHGPPGLGKTHLLHAIGNYVRRYGGGMKVRYSTVESFTTDYVHAVRSKDDVQSFKERFRDVDVLLIDDIQFLAGKKRTKEEFFHTFNALYEAGGQLVITSDRPPPELEDIETRLRERFASGLVVELEPPDLDVRLAILRQRARHDGLQDVADDALRAIAGHVAGSVRALEGALIRVVAYASLEGLTLSPDVARKVLERLYPQRRRSCSLDDIRNTTARSFGLEPADLVAYDRRPEVAFARQVAMYLSRELTDQTLPAIGKSFGGRNHTTILHAHRRVAGAIDSDPDAARTVAAIRERLAGDDRAE